MTQPNLDEQDLPIQGQVTFLYFRDMDAAEGFYAGVLGLRKTFDKGWVRFFQVTPVSFVGLVDEKYGHHRAGGEKSVMVSIETPALEAWYARMVQRGAEFQTHLDLEKSASQMISAFLLRDPGGYSVEFFRFNDPTQSPTARA